MAAASDVDTDDDSDGLGCSGCLKAGGVLFVGYALLANFPSVFYSLVALVVGTIGGIVVRAYTNVSPTWNARFRVAGFTTLGLGGAALVTSLVLMLPLAQDGDANYPDGTEVESTGGTVGPITMEEGRWINVKVRQDIESTTGYYQRWSFVTVELLDENKEYLSSFGGEHWNYAGVDNEGYSWQEDDEEYDATLWMPAGTYYVRLKTESNVSSSELGPVRLWMKPEGWLGNPRPLQWLAYIAFALGAVLVLGAWKNESEASGGKTMKEDLDD